MYNHGFYLESACFVLGLAAVHRSGRFASDCLEKLHIGLRLLQQLGSEEPVKSTSAAVEQMISRICALPRKFEASTEQTASDDQSPTAVINPPYFTDQSTTSFAAASTLDSTQDVFAPISWDNYASLNDLWSMMDWNVGFSSIDPMSGP